MRIEGIRAVKAHLNRIVGRLPAEGSVVITRNGRPCAVLMPVTEDTDLEAVALATSKRFWTTYDRARACGDRKGWDAARRHRGEAPCGPAPAPPTPTLIVEPSPLTALATPAAASP